MEYEGAGNQADGTSIRILKLEASIQTFLQKFWILVIWRLVRRIFLFHDFWDA